MSRFMCNRTGWLARPISAAASLGAALLAAMSVPAAAQQIKPLEVEQDPNGVDYLSGKISKRMPQLSIPAAPELTFEKLTDFWPVLQGTVVPQAPDGRVTYSINAGGLASDSFNCTEFCVGAKGTGSVLFGGGSVGPYYYTQGGTGRKVTFTLQYGDQNPPNPGTPFYYVGTSIYTPGGAALEITYDTGNPYSGYYYLSMRPSKVISSSGYQLRFTYQSNTVTSGSWRLLQKAEIVKTSEPGVVLASLTYSNTSPNVTITDLAGRQYVCAGCQNELNGPQPGYTASLTLPGEASASSNSTYTSTAAGHVLNVTGDGVSYSYEVVDDPNFASMHDPVDRVVVTGPDGFYRKVEVTNTPAGSGNPPRKRITSITESQNRITSYLYDGSGRVTRVTSPEGNAVEVAYDGGGNITTLRKKAKPGSGLADIVETAGYSHYFECDAVGCFRPLWTRDGRGNQTDYTWDPYHGGLLTRLDPANAQGKRRKVRNTWSGDRLIAEEICETDASGNELTCGTANSFVRQITYFGGTLLPLTETVTDGAGNGPLTTSYSYDTAGRLLSQDGPLPGNGDAVFFGYDILGRKVWEVGAVGEAGTRPATRTTYRLADDQASRVESGYVNAAGDTGTFQLTAQTDTEYSARRLPVKNTVSSGGTPYSLTQISYDALNRSECTAVRMNPAVYGSLPASACSLGTAGSNGPDRINVTVYGTNEKVWKEIRAYGTTLQQDYATYSYTPNGQIASMTDARGYRASMVYDGFDRQTHWYFPSPTTPGVINPADYELYGYDANGNRTSLRKRDGSVISYQYDALNRMTVKQVPERAGLDPLHTRDVYYQYDIRGLQTHSLFDSLSGHGPVTGYDRYGRIQWAWTNTDGVGRQLNFQYDANGNRTRIQHDDGAFFDYFYDGAGRPVRIQTPSGVGMVAFTYDARGLPYQRASGSWSTFSYDPVGRLSTQAEDMAGSSGDVTWSFTRNPASQILTETQNNDAYSWNGHVDLTRSYATNGLNQYTSAGGYTFAHDANGNLISDGISSYLYDVENRLVRVTGGGHTTDLYYDPLGRLYRTTSTKPGTGTIRYLYDGDALVAEYDGAGTLIRRHVHGPAAGVDDPLATFAGSSTDGSTASLLKSDPRGSIAAAVDWSGNLQSINTYDEYGINGTGNTGRFQYTGQAWLPEIGMYYYKARIYSPTLGRFLQTDPIGYEDQVNLYAYVGNDPINGIDPSGEELVVLEGPDPTDRTAVLNTLAAAARADPVLKQRLIAIMKSENVIAVKPNSGGPTNAPPSNYRDAAKPGTDPDATGKGSGSRVNLNMDAENIQGNIVHEILGHAYDSDQGQLDMSRHPTGIRQYEEDATQIENRYHQATDPTKVRDDYNGRPIKPLDE